MNIHKEFLLAALLQYNYLPTQRKTSEELPPIFSTSTFFTALGKELANLPYRKGLYGGYDQVEYKLTRFNSVTRTLSFPHPLPHTKLCVAIHEKWEEFAYIVENESSHIKPCHHEDGRIVIMNAYSETVSKASNHLTQSFGKLYRVETDLANCFPSIYSHALPWALVGLDTAKASKDNQKIWFNVLDKHLRHCRRNETQGIAIGPATSNIISEAILARIDNQLKQDGFEFTRFIDDYTCDCLTEEDAKKFVNHLEKAAAKYKLHLNIKKTKISKLPAPSRSHWITQLSHRNNFSSPAKAFDAFQFLDYAVTLASEYPEGSVLKYAANTLAKLEYGFHEKVYVFMYLLSLSFHYPGIIHCLNNFLDAIHIKIDEKNQFWLHGYSEKFEQLVIENAKCGRSDGMCWSLYYLGRMGAEIKDEVADAVITSQDVFSMLTLYWTGQHLDKILEYCTTLNSDDLYELDRNWILLYQLFLYDHIVNPYTDGVFEVLKKSNFSIFKTLNDLV